MASKRTKTPNPNQKNKRKKKGENYDNKIEHTNFQQNIFTSLLSLTLIIISIIVIVNGISKSFTKTNVEMSKHEKFVDYVERTGTAPTRENYEYYLKNN